MDVLRESNLTERDRLLILAHVAETAILDEYTGAQSVRPDTYLYDYLMRLIKLGEDRPEELAIYFF